MIDNEIYFVYYELNLNKEKRTMSVYKPFITGKIKDLAGLTTRGQRAYHGDVIIIKCDESDFPTDFDTLPNSKNLVLAEGEHSGHAHAFFSESAATNIYDIPKFDVLEGGKGKEKEGRFDVKVKGNEMYLRVSGAPMLLKHQEHTAFRIYPGTYEITRQTEMWDDMKRAVVD